MRDMFGIVCVLLPTQSLMLALTLAVGSETALIFLEVADRFP